ncbi:hypothetical protein ACFLYU_01615 [Candidatus Dependentiae bacterium]
MNIKKYLLVLLFAFSSLYGTKISNVAIFLEKQKKYGSQEENTLKKEYTLGAVLSSLISAIEQNVEIIIVSEPLARALITFTQIPKTILLAQTLPGVQMTEPADSQKNTTKKFLNDIGKKWSVYKTPSKSFAILVRGPSPKIKNLGLNNDLRNYKIKNKKEFLDTFSKISSLRGINLKELLYIFKGNYPKIVFIIGHGFPSVVEKKSKEDVTITFGTFASLNYKQNAALLEKLNKSGCLFAYYNTCYVGGQNVFFLNKKVNQTTGMLEKIPLNFPIMIGAFSDTPALSTPIKLNKFFAKLQNFFYKRKIKVEPWIKEPFKDIAKTISGKILENTPSIIFPGMRQPIKTIKVDNKVLVITYPFLLHHELKVVEKARKKGKKIKETKTATPIDITGKEAVALFPMLLMVPLKVKGSYAPARLVSMISGKAHHYIIEIDARKITLGNFIAGMFGRLKIASPKLFFIDKLICKYFDGKIVDIKNLIVTNTGGIKKDITLNGVYQYQNIWYSFEYNSKTKEFGFSKFDKQETVLGLIQEAIKQTTPPFPAVLLEATGGRESAEQFKKKVYKKLGIPLKKIKKKK